MRLFFALWPDAMLRHELAQWARLCQRVSGGRAVPPGNLHATLAFLGKVEPHALPVSLGTALETGPFELVLDRIGYWRHNRIAFAAAVETPAPLAGLARRLASALAVAGYRIDARPYVPHVTLIRDGSDPGSVAVAPLSWRVDEIALVESRRDEARLVYRPLRRWTLAA